MIQNSELPIISRILRQAHSDSTFPLQERISSLALQVIKDNSPDRLNSLWNPSNLYEPKKELKAQLNLKIGSLVDEILHSGTSPLHDPHGVLALKHAVISQSPDVAFYFRRLDLRVEPFLQNIYCESFDIEYTSSIQPTHYLWAGDLFVEEQSIFDYIHEKLEGDLELGSPTVVKLVKAQALNNAELLSSNLFSMLFLRIAQESDAETFKKLLLPLSHDIKEAFFAFCKKLPRRFTTRDYSDPKLLHYLSFFENSGSLTLIKIIEDIPLGKQASILQSINITDPELVYQVAKTLLSKNESIFFATIDQFPLDEKRKNTLIIEAVRNSKELYRIHFLLNSRGNLICPESCFFEIIDKLLNQAEAKIDTWGSSLYELNRAFNVNSRTRFMPLVWGKALFRAFEMFSRGDRPYDEQLKIAASWIRHMPPWVDPDIFIDFFAKENPAFLEFTDKWKREPNKKIYEKILTSGMRLLSCFHEAGLPTPPYVFEHILPLAVVSQTATIQLDYISNYLEPTQFITLMEFLEFAHPESETGLCEKEILTGIKPYFSEIDEEKWDYLENLSNIENAKIRQNLFTFVKDAAPQIPIIPGIIFDNIIPTIAKCRNKELLLILENSFHKILHTRRILKNYEQLITSSSSNHLILPMLLLCTRSDAPSLQEMKEIKELLSHRLIRHDMRNADTGLSQAIQKAASRIPIAHLKRGLDQGSTQQIKTALSHLCFLHTYHKIASLETEWDTAYLTSIVQKTWQEHFGVDTDTIDNFEERFAIFFNSPRMAGKLEMYAANQAVALKPYIGAFIHSVLTDTFDTRRYDPTRSPHLQKLQQNYPEIYLKWQEKDLPTPLLQQESTHLVTQDFVQEMFRNAEENHHLGDYRIQETLEACGDNLIEQLIFQLIHEPPVVDKVQALIRALTDLPTPPELLNDVKGLLTAMQPQQNLTNLHIIITDDPADTFLCGTEVPRSCQRVDGHSLLNQALLAYVLDGKNKLIAIKDPDGKIVARRIFRLLFDEKGTPALFLERHYGRSETMIQEAILEKAVAYAASLHLSLYVQESIEESLPSTTQLSSLGSSLPVEYVDAVRGLTQGIYTLETTARLLTQPIDHDLATLHQALSATETIPYTQAIHDAAYCMNEKLSSDQWGEACRSYIAATGDTFSYNGEAPTGFITEPHQLLHYLQTRAK